MQTPSLIAALYELAPRCPGGEYVLMEAAEQIRQMSMRIDRMADKSSFAADYGNPPLWVEADPQLPLPDPTRP